MIFLLHWEWSMSGLPQHQTSRSGKAADSEPSRFFKCSGYSGSCFGSDGHEINPWSDSKLGATNFVLIRLRRFVRWPASYHFRKLISIDAWLLTSSLTCEEWMDLLCPKRLAYRVCFLSLILVEKVPHFQTFDGDDPFRSYEYTICWELFETLLYLSYIVPLSRYWVFSGHLYHNIILICFKALSISFLCSSDWPLSTSEQISELIDLLSCRLMIQFRIGSSFSGSVSFSMDSQIAEELSPLYVSSNFWCLAY